MQSLYSILVAYNVSNIHRPKLLYLHNQLAKSGSAAIMHFVYLSVSCRNTCIQPIDASCRHGVSSMYAIAHPRQLVALAG